MNGQRVNGGSEWCELLVATLPGRHFERRLAHIKVQSLIRPIRYRMVA